MLTPPVAIMSHGGNLDFVVQPDGFLTKHVAVQLPSAPFAWIIYLSILNTTDGQVIVENYPISLGGSQEYDPGQVVFFDLVGLPPGKNISWQVQIFYDNFATGETGLSPLTVDSFFTFASGPPPPPPGNGIPKTLGSPFHADVVITYLGPATTFWLSFILHHPSVPDFDIGPQQINVPNCPVPTQIPVQMNPHMNYWWGPDGDNDVVIAVYQADGRTLVASQAFAQIYTLV